ncbi:MAG: type II secretion system F family protein [Candidatus Omnitrophica bacterium]|nr:type II secretion system F family protein [Candidatus Omnitrophota bacterium]
MAEYFYRAFDPSGQTKQGTMEAEGVDAVAKKLKQLGYMPLTIKEGKGKIPGFGAAQRFIIGRRVPHSDLNAVTRQLATLQRTGIPLLVSLRAVKEEMEASYLGSILTKICQAVEEGKSLSESLAQHPEVFNQVYVQMVRAGETAGILDQMLDRLAQLGEHDEETSSQIRSAMQYPLIVLVTISLVFVFIMTFVIPRFSDLFGRFHTALPLATRVLLGISAVFQHHWTAVLLTVVSLIIGVRWFSSVPFGRRRIDRWVLKTPVFGSLFQKIYWSRFAQIVGLLSQGGVPIVETLHVAAEVTGNRCAADAIHGVARGVSEGKGLSEPMRDSKFFPPTLLHMVKVGEESGRMDELLLRASQHYDTQVAYGLKRLGVLVEPLLLAVLGAMVLVLALGVFIPMWNVIYLFRR